jgi:hypothetical protein
VDALTAILSGGAPGVFFWGIRLYQNFLKIEFYIPASDIENIAKFMEKYCASLSDWWYVDHNIVVLVTCIVLREVIEVCWASEVLSDIAPWQLI